ncbi:MAG: ABC-F family ATP-binding cassette domain-containing protein [Streptosporangiaceae bacterium]
MNLISLERVSKAYGPRALLADVSLGVDTTDHIGVVGHNGAGKSTLLSLLAGASEPDSGRIARMSGLRIGHLAQQDRFDGTVLDVVFGQRKSQVPWEADAHARSVMAELLKGISLDADVSRLSGGERRRTGLAALLVAELDVLLLDEPTNHLDIEAIDWLGRHLRGRTGAVVLVTHDRWLLDTVCDTTWEVADGQVHMTEGGYSAYVLAQAERLRREDAAEQRRRNLARKELAWLRRGPQARGTKAKFRVDSANALIAAEPPARDRVELTAMASARLGKTVLELEDVTLSLGSRVLLDHVTWQLGPEDRVGIVGVNGAGKTSLLRLLDGSLVPSSGKIVRGKTVRIAHLSQDLVELNPALRVREAAEEIRSRITVGKRELSAGQLLERLGFIGDRQWTPVAEISGGERRRLQMLRLLLDEPNVLLLDEPTNDLDIETLTEFEDLLDDWPGTLVVVSHDRYFLERVTDHVMALPGDGSLRFLPGGVDEFVALTRSTAPTRSSPTRSSPTRSSPTRSMSHRPGSNAVDVTSTGPRPADARVARKELARLDRQIERLTGRETALGEEMAGHATDYEKLTKLGAELRSLQDEKAALEERWLEVAGSLEDLAPVSSDRGQERLGDDAVAGDVGVHVRALRGRRAHPGPLA